MKNVEWVGDLFKTHPARWWGYRGDPFLWKDMAENLAQTRLPKTYSEFAILLENTYEELTGRKISDTDNIHIDRYAHGGMSSGMIAPGFWRTKAFPLLFKRFAATFDTEN